MQRSKQLLMVYVELRRALSDTVKAGDALEYAKRLVDVANYRKIIDLCGTADFSTPGCLPVDSAFEDGGWALLHDCYASGVLGDDDPIDYSWRPGRRVASLLEHWV